MIRRNLVIAVASVAVAVAVAVAGASAGGAQAATTCTHSVPGLLEVYMSKHVDQARLTVSAAAIGVRGEVGTVACGGAPATTTSIDTVLVVDESDNLSTPAVSDGNTLVTINDPASFGPGKTAEADGASEIEFLVDTKAGNDELHVGGTASQVLVAGNDGVSWTSDGDADVLGMPFDFAAAVRRRPAGLPERPRGQRDRRSALDGDVAYAERRRGQRLPHRRRRARAATP